MLGDRREEEETYSARAETEGEFDGP
jgi:hypothetical protein